MKKSTLVILVVFIILLVTLFVFETNNIQLLKQTPSPTAQLKVYEGWNIENIVRIDHQSGDLEGLSIIKNSDNSWTFPSSTSLVDQGTVQELLSTLESMVILTQLEPGFDLSSIGLVSPQHNIILTSDSQEKIEMWIGSQTPTGSGYYVSINNQPPIVISKYNVDSIIELLSPNNLVLQTATP